MSANVPTSHSVLHHGQVIRWSITRLLYRASSPYRGLALDFPHPEDESLRFRDARESFPVGRGEVDNFTAVLVSGGRARVLRELRGWLRSCHPTCHSGTRFVRVAMSSAVAMRTISSSYTVR